MNDYGMYENEAMVEKVTWGPPPFKNVHPKMYI